MFPTPIHQRPVVNQYIYKIFLPISLIIWLIPIFGILMTSIRGLGDITAGNMFPAVISPRPLIDVIKIPNIGISQIINEIGKNIL